MRAQAKKIFLLMSILSLAVFALSRCGSSTSNNYSATPTSSTAAVEAVDCSTVTPSGTVTIAASSFSPTSTTIAVNSVVKWANNDSITHTVTSGTPAALDNKFDSTITPAASLCFRFNTAGTYKYFCKIHPFMTGDVTVQ